MTKLTPKNIEWTIADDKIIKQLNDGTFAEVTASDITALGFVAWGLPFWWDGSDWLIDWLTNVTITGTNNTYITKNYTAINAWAVSRTFTITPTGCVLHIKVQWNVDLSNRVFDFAGKWAIWGTPWGWWAGAGWQSTVFDWDPLKTLGNWWSYSNWDAAGWLLVLSTNYYRCFSKNNYNLSFVWWAGGGWWAWSQFVGNATWFGGNWGGCIIFEIWWDIDFNGATIYLQWLNGNDANFNWGNAVPWWGWGWWGGLFVFYGGTTTWTETSNLNWGLWWAGVSWLIGAPWQPWGWWAGAGWDWSAWTGHVLASWAWTWIWGAWGIWIIIKKKIDIM